jgi:hypothetical protein
MKVSESDSQAEPASIFPALKTLMVVERRKIADMADNASSTIFITFIWPPNREEDSWLSMGVLAA